MSYLARGFLAWAWILGVIPAAQTWYLPDVRLEGRFAVVYLLLVFLAGSATWSLLESGSLLLLVACWLSAWAVSFLLVQAFF